jgi:uncharacterized membrane protein YbhN (UPF0104 family)
MSHSPNRPTAKYRRFVPVFVLALLLYVVVPQVSVFRTSLPSVAHADPHYFSLAVLAGFSTYLTAAGLYVVLAFKRLRFTPTVLVQVAGMFVNRLLPAGVGAVITANNLIGFIGHMLLLAAAIVLFPHTLHLSLPAHSAIIAAGVGLLFVAVVSIAYRFYRGTLRRRVAEFLKQIVAYRRRAERVVPALFLSMLLTMGNILCIWLCLQAVGAQLDIPRILIAYSLGVWLGTSIPTPGGLGGLEAGLAAGLVAYHLPSAQAAAAVILFRLITYWFGLLLGAPAFYVSERRGLFTARY